MIRVLLTGAVALGLAACAPREGAACNLNAAGAVAFSDPEAPDRVEARLIGPDCERAIGLLTIRSDDGTPLYVFASALYPRFGTLFEPRAQAVPQEQAQAFTDRWAVLEATRTSAAPAWPNNAPGPDGAAETSLERALYNDLRARDLPMLCHLSGVARETCLYWEPGAGAAVVLVERDRRTTPAE